MQHMSYADLMPSENPMNEPSHCLENAVNNRPFVFCYLTIIINTSYIDEMELHYCFHSPLLPACSVIRDEEFPCQINW